MEWRFVGGNARDFLYPVAFTVQPGGIIEADENPDPNPDPDQNWFVPVAALDHKKE